MWIYHFEQHPQLGAPAGEVIESLEAGKFRGVASELTLLELTVRPLQLGRQNVADDYEVLLDDVSLGRFLANTEVSVFPETQRDGNDEQSGEKSDLRGRRRHVRALGRDKANPHPSRD